MFRSIKQYGLSLEDLKTVYVGYIRPVLEYCAPVFHSSLTKSQIKKIEQIQKRVFRLILGKLYVSYENACHVLKLPTLESRRRTLCHVFAKSLSKHPICHEWLPPKRTISRALRQTLTYEQFSCKTKRYQLSPLPYFVDLLNGKK